MRRERASCLLQRTSRAANAATAANPIAFAAAIATATMYPVWTELHPRA